MPGYSDNSNEGSNHNLPLRVSQSDKSFCQALLSIVCITEIITFKLSKYGVIIFNVLSEMSNVPPHRPTTQETLSSPERDNFLSKLIFST